MSRYIIERSFDYKGFHCAVVKLGIDSVVVKPWRCGYVEIKDKNSWMHEDDAEAYISCHGGVTFFGYKDEFGFRNKCVGFDCAHLGDTLSNCSVDYCTKECQRIADQLDKLNNRPKSTWTIIFDEDSPIWCDVNMDENKERVLNIRENFLSSRQKGYRNSQVVDIYDALGLDIPDWFPIFRKSDEVEFGWHNEKDKIVIHIKYEERDDI